MNNKLFAVSPVTRDLVDIVRKTAVTGSPVLFCGEIGSGRKTFAYFSFLNGNRKDRPYDLIDCKVCDGVFLGQALKKCGTIFLEDIQFLSIENQNILLDAVRNKVDVKILASTCDDLNLLVQNGSFLEELFFRLNVFPVRIPPLRTRIEDIAAISDCFIEKYSAKFGKKVCKLSESSKKALAGYSWPGNINELECVIQRAVLVSKNEMISRENLFIDVQPGINTDNQIIDLEDKTLKNAINVFKREYVIKILEECGWNQTKAGKVLGIQRTYVSRLMNELHIRDIGEKNGN